MIKAIIELSKYILVLCILFYTAISYMQLFRKDEDRLTISLFTQDILIFVMHMTGSIVLLFSRRELTYLFLALFQVIAVFAFIVLVRVIYPNSNRLILNHIALLLSISFVILTRISFARSIRQFIIVAVSMVVALIIPAFMKNLKLIKKCELLYVLVGIGILGAVLVSGSITNGSKLSFSIFGVTFQPSEFVKIIYVFFVACILARAKNFAHIALSAVLAAAHVLILVASRDLGSALIFFVTYIVLLFVATKKIYYLLAGIFSGAFASVIAYKMFSHVRVRVSAWLNPWDDINQTGYQVAQSLFAIGTGSWFGMGIDAGSPKSIPYAEQDFMFAAICEEYGLIFGICLIAVCVNLIWEMVKVGHECFEPFVKYIVYGLAVVYSSQLFLTIGGNSKFVPLTGVTLPLISYGGSSVLATMIMLAVVQGFFINSDLVLSAEDADDDELPYIPKYPINSIIGVFSAGFLAICIYLGHYVYYDSPQIINNTYNSKRQELLAEKTIRGDIMSSDGELLATSHTKSGNRYYPFGNIFSHAIGYSVNGRMGVEQDANIYLVSSNISLGDKLADDFADERHLGNTVITTFDSKLQKLAYDALGIYNGAVIITEPSTGKILAMVSKPDFDPNEIYNIWDSLIKDNNSSVLVNRATQGQYPPGSTFKILTALEYVRENPVGYERYSFNCNGKFTSGESSIICYHGATHGTVDFTKSFAKSCNTSFANIGMSLDRDEFRSFLEKLYFDKALPVDFPAKNSGIASDIEYNDSNMIQTAIGQGSTLVTPVHMAMITSMIANDGIMMKPYTIEKIESAAGKTIKKYEPASLGEFISKDEADIMRDIMNAVIEEGTGTRLKSDYYKVAGKTGSAEYNSLSDSHAWFTGFTYDVENPIQITVIMEGAGSGGEYAVPVARRIFDGYYQG